MPNNSIISSTSKGLLNLSTSSIPSFIFKDSDLHQSLFSIPTIVNTGCTAIFNKTSITITNDETHNIVAYGTKSPTDTLWTIDIPPHISTSPSPHPHQAHVAIPYLQTPQANLVVTTKTNADFVTYVHATMGSPVLSAFIHAVSAGYLNNFPRITAKMITQNPPNTIATAYGHLDQTRQGQNSTSPQTASLTSPPFIPDSLLNQPSLPPSADAITANLELHDPYFDDPNNAFLKVIPISQTNHSDLTGRLPVCSRKGNEYILVSILNGYIHMEPMPNKQASSYVNAFTNTIEFFESHGAIVSYQRLDNETSLLLEKYLKRKNITLQYVPPNTHRANKAERAIRDARNHIISSYATTHTDFPLNLWDEILPQIELSLNLLHPYHPDPTKSAYEGLYGKKYDFLAHPIAPVGTLVVVHEKPAQRASWAPHGLKGFYLGPALKHYRSWRTWIIGTQSLRISDTLAWFPNPLILPGSSPHEMLHASITDFTRVLHLLLTNSNLISTDQMPFTSAISTATQSLTDLANMFTSLTTPTSPLQRVPPSAPPSPPVQRVLLNPPPITQPSPAVVPLPPAILIPPPTAPPGLPHPPSVPSIVHIPSSPIPSQTLLTTTPIIISSSPPAEHNPRDSRLRQQPIRKAYQTTSITSEKIALDNAIALATAEREFQQALSDDNLFRLGLSTSSSHAALNLTASGDPLTRAAVMSSPESKLWMTADSEEYSRLSDSSTFHPIFHHQLPLGRIATYYNPQYREKIDHKGDHERRCRGTIGGDRLPYPGAVSARTADMEVVKVLLNSALSDDAELMTLDIKDYYLGTPLDRPEYIRIDIKFIPNDCMIKYNLHQYVHNNFILHEVNKGMYGLKQAGLLAQNKLISHLTPAGYIQSPSVPCLFIHAVRNTAFTLIVDDFCCKYNTPDDAEHLITTLQDAGYVLKIDMSAKKYIGLTIERDRVNQTITISMPGYIAKILQRFAHRITRQAKSPSIYIPPKYGSHIQYPAIDTSPPLTPAAITELQEIVGCFLYYARSVDATMLTATCAVSSDQATPTQQLENQADRLLSYGATYPDNKVVFKKSDMIQIIQSDCSYLSRSHARSVAGGISYLGNANDDATFINGNIFAFSKIIDVVVASVGEGEYASVFLNAQAGEYVRSILIALGHPQPPTIIYCDNECAVGLANDTVKMKRSKSIDMRFHWIRDRIKQGHFVVTWIKGANNLADFFTKALPVHVHQSTMRKLVFTPLPSSTHFASSKANRYLRKVKTIRSQ
jgi:hypothetical protein